MKALLIVLAVLLVVAHPAAAALVVGAELAACGLAAWMVRRAFCRNPCLHWRSA